MNDDKNKWIEQSDGLGRHVEYLTVGPFHLALRERWGYDDWELGVVSNHAETFTGRNPDEIKAQALAHLAEIARQMLEELDPA